MNLFADEQTHTLVDVFTELHRVGMHQAQIARGFFALLMLFGLAIHSPSFSDFFYHLAIIALWFSVGLVYLGWHSKAQSQTWQPYLMVVADVCLLTLGMLYHPYEPSISIPPSYMFLAYFALLALHSLYFIPRLAAWSAVVAALFWMLGLAFLLDSNSPEAQRVIQASSWLSQIVIIVSVGGILSFSMRQLSHFVLKQLNTEREFHNILLTERDSDGSSETEYNRDAFADPLTGLGTRAAFERDSSQFARVFNEGRLIDLSIALIDLEGAEKVLEERGEAAYHELMQAFAKVSRAHFRSSDMPYHLGDNQFALLAPGATPGNSDRLRKLLDAIVAEVRTQGFPEISAKMGLSTLHEATREAAA